MYGFERSMYEQICFVSLKQLARNSRKVLENVPYPTVIIVCPVPILFFVH